MKFSVRPDVEFSFLMQMEPVEVKAESNAPNLDALSSISFA